MSSVGRFLELPIDHRMTLLGSLFTETIKCVTLHPVNLQLFWKELIFPAPDVWDSMAASLDDEEIDISLEDFDIEEWTWDTVLFPQCKTLHIYSDQTGDRSVRGGGCGNEDFPVNDFRWTIETPDGINLRHLNEAIYRMKGSKYDYYYELLCGTRFISEESHPEKAEVLTIKVRFDYGS